MYAIVDIAGQQFKVEAGKQIFVNRQAAEVGASVSYDKVLLLAGDEGGVKVGNPYVEGAAVNATVLEHCKADKVIIFKKERRKGYQKKNGHRQYLTKLQIEGIA
ncbi:MAG: 50S ribosomal protein L21 [Bacteroidales bacterium]|nr:50S ribosomal protein L21 [Bacteroidales bacterium]